MDQGKLISRAWELTWNNRVLWGLGFLAALAGGGGGGANIDLEELGLDPNSLDQSSEVLNDSPLIKLVEGDSAAFAEFFTIIGAVVAAGLVLGIIFWLVGNTARAALIQSTVQLEQGSKPQFGTAFRNGWSHIWRIFLLKLTVFLIFALPVLVLGGAIGGIAFAADAPALSILLVPLICVFSIAAILVQFADAFGFRAIVLKGMGPVEALRHGWQIFRANAADVFILAVIFAVVSFVIGIIVSIVLGVFALVASSPLLDYLLTGTVSAATMGLGIVSGLVATIVAAAILALLVAWQSATFTLAYQEMTGDAVTYDPKTPADLPTSGEFI